MLTEKQLRNAICSAIEVSPGDEEGSFRVAVPYDVGGGDLCQVIVKSSGDTLRLSDEGLTLQKVMELGERYKSRSFTRSLASILEVNELVESEGEIIGNVDGVDLLGDVVFELCQTLASIVELSSDRPKTVSLPRERAELRTLADQRFSESRISDRPLFRRSDTLRVKFGGTRLPIPFHYGYGSVGFPETVYHRVVAQSQSSVTNALLKFDKARHNRTVKKVALIAAPEANVDANEQDGPVTDSAGWTFDQGKDVLLRYSTVIDLGEEDSPQQLLDTVSAI